jgi:hypothetical protein
LFSFCASHFAAALVAPLSDSANTDEPLARVVRRMRGGHRLVVVTDGARELGVVTGDDILPRLMPAGADGESPPGPTSGN